MTNIAKLKNQIKEMKRTEENAAKKLEMLEKQSSYMRSRASSATGFKSQDTDSLEGVWQVVKDLREKMAAIQESVEEGVNEKCKELNFSVIEKDNEYIKLLEESDSKLRQVKADFRKELRELKEKHKASHSALMGEVDALKLEKVDFLRKINELEAEKQNSNLNAHKAKILADQNRDLKENIKTKEENMTLDKEVLEDFVKQIEERDSARASYESKFKEIRKKSKETYEKLMGIFQTVTTKKKLYEKDIQELYHRVIEQIKGLIQVANSDTRSTLIKR